MLAGDMTAALAYLTPAGGAVVTAVAPVGLRDSDAGTVTFTTSLGFGKKLERIAREPRVALAYHAREHGFATAPPTCSCRGAAVAVPPPDPDWNERVLGPAAERVHGPAEARAFWDRWLQEYYADRVPVTVDVERVVVWPTLDCSGEPVVTGSTDRLASPSRRPPPKNGTGPRLDAQKAAARLARSCPPAALLARSGRLPDRRRQRAWRAPAPTASASRAARPARGRPPCGRPRALLQGQARGPSGAPAHRLAR